MPTPTAPPANGLERTDPLPIEATPPAWLYLSWHGRIDRRTFWRAAASIVVMSLALTALLMVARLPLERAARLADLLVLWPAAAISAKRWHDSDRSAWWLLLVLVPVIGPAWLLIDNTVRPGSHGHNRFGPPPPPDVQVTLRPAASGTRSAAQ